MRGKPGSRKLGPAQVDGPTRHRRRMFGAYARFCGVHPVRSGAGRGLRVGVPAALTAGADASNTVERSWPEPDRRKIEAGKTTAAPSWRFGRQLWSDGGRLGAVDEEATTRPQHGLAHENPGDAADLSIPLGVFILGPRAEKPMRRALQDPERIARSRSLTCRPKPNQG
jgi:hypothetical protein